VNRLRAISVVFCLSFCLLGRVPNSLAQGNPPTPATSVARYAYAVTANEGEKNPFVAIYSVNPTTGALRPVQVTVPPSDNFGVVIDPSNTFLYLPDGPDAVGYRIAPNGALQSLKGSPFTLDAGSTIAFTPNGQFAYSNLGGEFSLNTTTGALTQFGTAGTNGDNDDVAITPSGAFVYILGYGDKSVSAFAVDQTSGALTEISGSPFPTGGSDALYSEAISPNGQFLFVTTYMTGNSGFTNVFSINASTGALTQVSGSPFASPGGNTVVDSTGQFLYVAGENLAAYSINSTTGFLTPLPGSPYSLPAPANAFTFDPTGKFLYVSLVATATYAGVPGIVTYSLNSSTGALTQIAANGSYGNEVEALGFVTGAKAVVYTPRYAYATNQASKSISEWKITDSTGALTAVAGSPLSDANGPQLVAATPSGAFVYTANNNNSISEYAVTATTGALTLVNGSPLTGFGSVNALAVDPTSSYLFVLDSAKQVVDSYTISPKTGALTSLSSVAAPGALTLALDPLGLLAIATTATDVEFSGVSAGELSAFGSITTKNPPGAAAFDQSGQYFFVTEPKNNTIATFNAVAFNGQIKQLSAAATGNSPGAALAEPSGKYVYVANTADGTITGFSLSNATGALKKIATAAAAAGTDSLATSNDGKYLYATDNTAGLVSIFKITSTGSLTSVGSATTGASPTSIATTGTHQ
jgi:6-phosphogluconolactonase